MVKTLTPITLLSQVLSDTQNYMFLFIRSQQAHNRSQKTLLYGMQSDNEPYSKTLKVHALYYLLSIESSVLESPVGQSF